MTPIVRGVPKDHLELLFLSFPRRCWCSIRDLLLQMTAGTPTTNRVVQTCYEKGPVEIGFISHIRG